MEFELAAIAERQHVGEVTERTPITGIGFCCACAARGQKGCAAQQRHQFSPSHVVTSPGAAY
jgi:hypothetical protein